MTRSKIHPKVKAGAQAGGTVTAMATVIAWVADQYKIDMPLPVAVSISSILTTTAMTAASYYKKQKEN